MAESFLLPAGVIPPFAFLPADGIAARGLPSLAVLSLLAHLALAAAESLARCEAVIVRPFRLFPVAGEGEE
jgi:hypothetical protein